ncbi:hypothetical protein LX99_04808 [Mucilaginibacter oryzae]|uniref:DUF2116 family Zn-ribbon domain-containing protein n=2 Tax=Mucilaginibacter oryzae TaxID=468058 RepID=A0A316GV07_9SPHI|nr:hypothetical protein LX99_04808 [Mucilaginibacter oryzae]
MDEEKAVAQPKTCLECGLELGAGRSDRKFCDHYCRIAYNNKRRSEGITRSAVPVEPDPEQQDIDRDIAAMNKIFDILVSNRIKLFNMYHIFERRVPISDFHRFGINLKYYTSEHQDDYYETLFKMCFDYGYHIDGEIVYITYSGSELYFN